MKWNERGFEFLLIIAMAFCLWNLVVVAATRGVFVDSKGRFLSRGTSAAARLEHQVEDERRPVFRLGAAKHASERKPLELDRAVWELVTGF